jgi:hypothetical protein
MIVGDKVVSDLSKFWGIGILVLLMLEEDRGGLLVGGKKGPFLILIHGIFH